MSEIFSQLKWFIGLVLFQVLILNQMHINGYATPFLYIYFILQFRSRAGRNELMLWAFFMGLVVDMFCNTPGMNAAAATGLAFFRTLLLRMVTLRDLDENFRPSPKVLGYAVFFRYLLLTCTLFCLLFFLINTFSFLHIPTMLLKIFSSTATTILCIMGVESTRRK